MSATHGTGTLDFSLDLQALQGAYATQTLSPSDVVDSVLARIEQQGEDNVWISRITAEELRSQAAVLTAEGPRGRALFGIPFAVKDNVDVAGLPTTAACPDFAYDPTVTAPAVQRLIEAGAILIGKTNLDQFATGLVGVRSPYGTPRNPFDADVIPGGSSSGSAVAVAAGLVTFAIGTDTAGSGRIPAGLNNIVGMKPSRGLFSTRGVVPACRSLDCLSVFALTCDDAMAVAAVMAGFDAEDPFSRQLPLQPMSQPDGRLRIAVPRPADREFFGDDEARSLFNAAVAQCAELDADIIEIDFAPFREASSLLYNGAWLAERHVAVGGFCDKHPDSVHPVTRQIIAGGRTPTAADAFAGNYRLAELIRAAEPVWRDCDALLVPTAPTVYRVSEVEADPLGLNANLGAYTNFVNLMDLCGVAVPQALRSDGVPCGVTFLAPAGRDGLVMAIGRRFHGSGDISLGATGRPLPRAATDAAAGGDAAGQTIRVAVFGAHMRGLPLSRQLRELGARYIGDIMTAAAYRLYLVGDVTPIRPGLVRSTNGDGRSIAGEVWAMTHDAFGRLTGSIRPPLCMGNVTLADGSDVMGFLGEPALLSACRDITEFGGWRGYLAAAAASGAE